MIKRNENKDQRSNDENNKSKDEINKSTHVVPSGPSVTAVNILVTVVSMFLFFLAFLFALPCQIIFFILLFPVYLIWPRIRIIAGGLTLRIFHCLAVMFNPFIRCKVVRPPPEGWKPTRTIVFSNHLSSLDPWAITRNIAPWELKWVYKKDLDSLPLFGLSIRLCHDLPIEFMKGDGGWKTKPGSVKAMFDKVKSYLAMGIGLVVFPEGTRSKSGRLQRFKPGFLKLAIEEKVEIMPVVLWNSNTVWPLGTHILSPGTVYFSWGTPFMPSNDETVETLEEKVKNQMMEMLSEMPGFNPNTMQPLTEFTTRGDNAKAKWG